MGFPLSDKARRRIRREAVGHEGHVQALLTSEAWLRRWLIRRGVPCWTHPELPGYPGRYGLLLWNGSRILVEPGFTRHSRDRALEARCGIIAWVEARLEDGEVRFQGWCPLSLLPGGTGGPEGLPPERLPDHAGVPLRFLPAYIAGSLRLLLAGEPAPPAADLAGVPLYRAPARKHAEVGTEPAL